MINTRLMKNDEIEVVANFISELNRVEESHIGYCGVDPLEIAYSLKEDLTDITYENSFLIAYDDEGLIGVLGFDADLENQRAEIWGPFVKDGKWDNASCLWTSMLELLPEEIISLGMFPNKENHRVLELAENLSFNRHSDQTILSFHRSRLQELEVEQLHELEEEYFPDIIQLHDQSFPETYYSGEQIIDRLNEERKVFIVKTEGRFSGYIYVEAQPEFGEGSIEFFAVPASERGKGIGEKLLSAALNWFFTFESIQSITLSVSSGNRDAIGLYKKVGFEQIHELCYFTKKI
ncbi:GNAT family N-acetyltransferase [Mesobacillus jeotgali]|uniref:GNAT family N-acetyltransferase n=1 Tax=Mesobacillus jeotgali TaxID=129985 RepID=A0ABY9VLW2_9BACI|nr:GNAT family N-acetyltransferase [Mesobacillus jeotgali]WNF24957.1 GNAT family N-acetyltransferase [Mesobacillus jeotgali]